MKTCPCCSSVTFDDMDTCFVCMHKFPMNQDNNNDNISKSLNLNVLSSLGEIVDGTIDKLVELPKTNNEVSRGIDDACATKLQDKDKSANYSMHDLSENTLEAQDLNSQCIKSCDDLMSIVDTPIVDTDIKDSKPDEYANKTSWNYTDTLCADIVVEPETNPTVKEKIFSWNLDIELEGFPEYKCKLSNNGERLTIGRATNNDIIVPDLKVSRKHAEMFVSQDKLWIVDCGSKNMTILDGVPVMGTREISSQATIKIGSARIEILPA